MPRAVPKASPAWRHVSRKSRDMAHGGRWHPHLRAPGTGLELITAVSPPSQQTHKVGVEAHKPRSEPQRPHVSPVRWSRNPSSFHFSTPSSKALWFPHPRTLSSPRAPSALLRSLPPRPQPGKLPLPTWGRGAQLPECTLSLWSHPPTTTTTPSPTRIWSSLGLVTL